MVRSTSNEAPEQDEENYIDGLVLLEHFYTAYAFYTCISV
jgi:hypothetical protein